MDAASQRFARRSSDERLSEATFEKKRLYFFSRRPDIPDRTDPHHYFLFYLAEWNMHGKSNYEGRSQSQGRFKYGRS